MIVPEQDSEPQLSLATLDALHQVSYREAGLILLPEKVRMVQSRLRYRLKETGIDTFESYLALVRTDAGARERRMMISALTTNVSHFFREPHHFDILADEVLPKVKARLKAGGRFRIWSAGCSNGQEAFSIVMHLLDKDPSLLDADFRIRYRPKGHRLCPLCDLSRPDDGQRARNTAQTVHATNPIERATCP